MKKSDINSVTLQVQEFDAIYCEIESRYPSFEAKHLSKRKRERAVGAALNLFLTSGGSWYQLLDELCPAILRSHIQFVAG